MNSSPRPAHSDSVDKFSYIYCSYSKRLGIKKSAPAIERRHKRDAVAAEPKTVEEWRATLDLNLSTPFFLARGVVPAMRAKGAGRILNIASLQASRAFPDGAPYGASKGGVAQLTRAMAEAWSRDGILCNALAPGFFPTDLTARVFEDRATVDRLAAQTCLGRNGRLEDLIGPAVFFCSDAAGYVTRQILYVDGGFTAP